MTASDNQYQELWGIIPKFSFNMAKCACVACNSCTCGCSCRRTVDAEELPW